MIKVILKRVFITVIALYACLHMVVASTPIQRRLLEEIRQALLRFGLDLKIESVEFSAFVPRFYLNRVTVATSAAAPFQFPEPLVIDKIKVQFQPLGLLQKKITISEMILFHPRIFVPHAEVLYKRIKKILETQSKISVEGAHFEVEFKKVGIVDASFHVESQTPSFSIRSRSMSVFLRQDSAEQQNLVVSSNHLEVDQLKLQLAFQKFEVDLDLSAKSLRLNQGLFVGEDFNIQLKGATALPKTGKEVPDSFHAIYDLKMDLRYLNLISKLSIPFLAGGVASNGNVKLHNGGYSGTGNFSYNRLELKGNKIGDGKMQYSFEGEKLQLQNAQFLGAGGSLSTSQVLVQLAPPYSVTSQLDIKNVKLRELLSALKEENVPVQTVFNGTLGVQGQLQEPFELECDLKTGFSDLLVLNEIGKPPIGENKIISIKSGQIIGGLTFTQEQMGFRLNLDVLQGKTFAEGFIGFNDRAEVKLKSSGLSLTELHTIADLQFKGTTDLEVDVEVKNQNVRIEGGFETSQAVLSDLHIGKVKGKAFYEEGLLAFEDLNRVGSDPVRGNGYVDFRPKNSHYRFDVSTRRASVDDLFSAFKDMKLGFPVPKGGETKVRIRIEGGHDADGLEVIADGQARSLEWYGENWLSSTFNLTYRPKATQLTRALLVKRSGALEVRGRFEEAEENSEIQLISRGLRLEELNRIGKTPLQGEVIGSIRLRGNFFRPVGEGNIRLVNTAFRGNRLEDSNFELKTSREGSVLSGTIVGERLRFTLLHSGRTGSEDQFTVRTNGFDATPLLSLWFEKDLPPIAAFLSTGEASFKNVLQGWSSVSGEGALKDLQIGFRGNLMKNEDPIQFKIRKGALNIDRFRLEGPQGRLSLEYTIRPDQTVVASADGKLELQHVQPFIPGLEYGSGKLSLGLRMSGPILQYTLLGSIQLEDGSFRLEGIEDEFRSVGFLLSVSQERINVDRFDAQMGGGKVAVTGDVHINRFRSLIPNLLIQVAKVQMKVNDALTLKLNGDFSIKGATLPYTFFGKCHLIQGRLINFKMERSMVRSPQTPLFKFDVRCEAKDQLLVQTDVMDAEFKGNLRLTGSTHTPGLLGEVNSTRGSILFKDTKFNLETGTVRFEDPNAIAPRFNVAGRARVVEQVAEVPQSYDVNLQAIGTPSDYKIRLASVPQLSEPELISLLVLGVTSRSREGNYVDFGTTLVGQTPFQTKLQEEFGLDVKVSAQKSGSSGGALTPGTLGTDTTVPSVKVQKEVTKKTKVSVSNTIDVVPLKEFKIEHMLNDNFTVNGARTEKNKGLTADPSASYGVDFRYRFSFE